MTPGSFDPVTARTYIGDAMTRMVEAEARRCADEYLDLHIPGVFLSGETYQITLFNNMIRVVMFDAYEKRKARIARKAST